MHNSRMSRRTLSLEARWGCQLLLACCALALLSPSQAQAEAVREPERLMALGIQLDLLPTVLSAANGKAGYAPQVWLGLGHVRLRLISAHLQPPDGFAGAPKGFHDLTTTVMATVFDYTFGTRFDGAWLCSGVEVWQRSIRHPEVAGTARWSSTVFTFGGGYIWRFAGDFYLDPWAGVHAVLNPHPVWLGDHRFRPRPIEAEASLKVGWFLTI
jgi:hypothetical protein